MRQQARLRHVSHDRVKLLDLEGKNASFCAMGTSDEDCLTNQNIDSIMPWSRNGLNITERTTNTSKKLWVGSCFEWCLAKKYCRRA